MNDDTLRTADLWRTRGDEVALATVVRTRRSAPRPLGSKFAVGSRGEMAGSVSGGCVEGAVVGEAQSVLKGGPPKLVFYGIANDEAWDVGLACGGEIWVWIERYEGWETPAERAARVTVINGDHAGTHAFVTADERSLGRRRNACEFERFEAGHELTEQRSQFDACELRAETEMDAVAKSDVTISVATRHIETQRIFEHGGIHIAREIRQVEPIAALDFDAVDRGINLSGTHEVTNRCGPANHLVDRVRQQIRVRLQRT